MPKAPDLALHILATPDAEQISSVDAAAGSLLSGKALLFLAAAEGALALEVQGGESRAVEEPKIESSLRGPRVAFVEELATNIALLRRTLPTPDLRLEPLHVGWAAPTGVTLAYLSQRLPRPAGQRSLMGGCMGNVPVRPWARRFQQARLTRGGLREQPAVALPPGTLPRRTCNPVNALVFGDRRRLVSASGQCPYRCCIATNRTAIANTNKNSISTPYTPGPCFVHEVYAPTWKPNTKSVVAVF